MVHAQNNSIIKLAIADDHVLFREALCKTINEWENCKVILQASSGKQLIEQINDGSLPDIVLTDLRMPELNGYDTIKMVKKKYPQIKFMVISMYESKEAIMLLLKAGAQGFIHKTAEPIQLKKAIYEIMRNGYYFSDHTVARIFKQALDTGNMTMVNCLTQEELIFLKLICTEKTYKEISVEMSISERHVEYLRNSFFERFRLQSRTGLAMQSVEKGLTS